MKRSRLLDSDSNGRKISMSPGGRERRSIPRRLIKGESQRHRFNIYTCLVARRKEKKKRKPPREGRKQRKKWSLSVNVTRVSIFLSLRSDLYFIFVVAYTHTHTPARAYVLHVALFSSAILTKLIALFTRRLKLFQYAYCTGNQDARFIPRKLISPVSHGGNIVSFISGSMPRAISPDFAVAVAATATEMQLIRLFRSFAYCHETLSRCPRSKARS